MKWKIGSCYQQEQTGMLIHVLTRIPTTIYGETLIAETIGGGFMALPEHDSALDHWTETDRSEWDRRVDLIKNPKRQPKLVEVPNDSAG